MAFILSDALDGFKSQFAHLAVHSADSHRRYIQRPRRYEFIRLYKTAFFVFFQESRLDEEIQRFRHFGGSNFWAASTCKGKRFRSRHSRGKFAEYRIFPAFKIAERIALYDFRFVSLCDRKHFAERATFFIIRFRVVKLDHLAKIFLLEIDKVHGLRHTQCSSIAQVQAAFACIFKMDRRGESRRPRELLPSERGLRLFLGIIIRNILAITRVFKYIFHCFLRTLTASRLERPCRVTFSNINPFFKKVNSSP